MTSVPYEYVPGWIPVVNKVVPMNDLVHWCAWGPIHNFAGQWYGEMPVPERD